MKQLCELRDGQMGGVVDTTVVIALVVIIMGGAIISLSHEVSELMEHLLGLLQ